MWNRIFSTICSAFVLTGPALAGEMTTGLDIGGGRNASAKLTLVRVNDPAADNETLKVRVSLLHVEDVKGYGFLLQYDTDRYDFLEARELADSFLKSGSGGKPVSMASNRTPGKLEIGAVKIDGQVAGGEGDLVDLVFRTSVTPSAEDFQITESVLVGLDGAVEPFTNVEIGDLRPLPDAHGLDRNAPNPFNPSTVIGFRLPEAGRVRLVVYNLLGQEVRVLVNEKMEAGYFTMTWDGTDELGRRVASGVYIYRMKAGAFSATRRMLLLK